MISDVIENEDPLFGHLDDTPAGGLSSKEPSEADKAAAETARLAAVKDAEDKRIADAVSLKELELRKQLDTREEKRDAAFAEEQARLRQYAQPATTTPSSATEEETNEFDPQSDGERWINRQIEIKSKIVAAGMVKVKEAEVVQVVSGLQAELNRVRQDAYGFERDKLEKDPYHGKYALEVDRKLVSWGISEGNRQDPKIRLEALNCIKGERTDDLIEEARQKSSNAPETAGGISVTADPEAAEIARFATDPMVAKAAAGLGYTPEEYAKQLRQSGITSL